MSEWQELLRDASRLRTLGRVEEAIAAYERLLAIKPDLPDSWYNLGWLQRRARRFEAALESYARALELGVGEPEEVHLNRAVILSDFLHRPEEAERELATALEKNPRFVPALLNLGNLREDVGDRDGARDAYRRVLGVEPTHALALARLAGLSHAPDLDSALAQRLRVAISGASPQDQADLGFALAGLLDAAGAYDEAFDAARAANEASRAATGARYDRQSHEALVERLIATFAAPASGSNPPPALFICGLFRSGSTLVEQILGAHSGVVAGGELDIVPALVAGIGDYPGAVAEADAAKLEQWREFYRRGLPPHGEKLLTDKRPDNFLHIGLIKTLFPAAKIVHTRRAPLDNLLSLYFLHLDPGMAYALDLDDLAHWHGQYERLMAHWKALYSNDIFDVDYDALVREPRSAARSLLRFLGLAWEDSLLDFHRTHGVVKTASVWQVRQPLHAQSSGRWRNYRCQLEPFVGRLGKSDEPVS
ncbi:MAG TPA: sulfotransferase [Sphingomicrobium sp.]|nr:sulfotransferase [Sphingomicrobium sp.]